MDEIKKQLEALFEDMLLYVKSFKQKTYSGIFEDKSEKYKPLLKNIETLCHEAGKKKRSSDRGISLCDSRVCL